MLTLDSRWFMTHQWSSNPINPFYLIQREYQFHGHVIKWTITFEEFRLIRGSPGHPKATHVKRKVEAHCLVYAQNMSKAIQRKAVSVTSRKVTKVDVTHVKTWIGRWFKRKAERVFARFSYTWKFSVWFWRLHIFRLWICRILSVKQLNYEFSYWI